MIEDNDMLCDYFLNEWTDEDKKEVTEDYKESTVDMK